MQKRNSVASTSLAILVSTIAASAQEAEVMVSTPNGFSLLDAQVAINDAGTVAFTGRDSANNSKAFVSDGPGQSMPVTFFSANRTFRGASINNAVIPVVATRDLVSGPFYLMRKWPVDGSTTFTTVGKSPNHFDSCQLYCDVNDNGIVAFSGLIGGSTATALFAGSTEPPTQLATYPGITFVRPQISNDNRIVFRDNQSTIRLMTYPVGAAESIAGTSNGFAFVGMEPGISPDGTVVAFGGDRGAGPGVFVAVSFSGGRQIVRVAGEGMDIFSSLSTDSRVGVTSRGSIATGQEIAVFFTGTQTEPPAAAVTGAFAIGIRVAEVGGAVETQLLGEGVPVLVSGQSVGGHVVSSVILNDPVNVHRGAAAWASTQGGDSAVVRIAPRGRSQRAQVLPNKFKQFDMGWKDKCLISSLSGSCPQSVGSFGNFGCTISSFTTCVVRELARAGIPYAGVTPVTVQSRLFMTGQQEKANGRIHLDTVTYSDWIGGHYFFVQTLRSTTFGFDTIIDELTAGRPVILGVPSGSTKASGTALLNGARLHYIMAYDYDPDVAALYGDSHGILVNDPGYGVSRYGLAG